MFGYSSSLKEHASYEAGGWPFPQLPSQPFRPLIRLDRRNQENEVNPFSLSLFASVQKMN